MSAIHLGRKIFAGGLAGVLAGWILERWMDQVGFFPQVARMVGSRANVVGWLLYIAVASLIGVMFGLLFREEVRSYGSGLGWGTAFGILWWFLGLVNPASYPLRPAHLDWLSGPCAITVRFASGSRSLRCFAGAFSTMPSIEHACGF